MNIYQEHGYHDRQDYLEALAENYCAPMETVEYLAELLGEDEDFDELITVLEEYDDVLGRL